MSLSRAAVAHLNLTAIAALLSNAANAQSVDDLPATSFEAVYPTVITPTRLRQSLQDVPASVTILTASTLKRFAITSVPEALRLVPGMAVQQDAGGSYRVNYHGTNSQNPRRMNVLIDGISVYRPGLSEIEWAQLPVAIEDIARIEVTRGPNSAAYGPNSMTAVINIITVHPGDATRTEITTGFGSDRLYRAFARGSTTLGAATTVHASLSTEGNRGYDLFSTSNSNHDTTSTKRLNLRSQTTLSETASLELKGAYVGGKNESPFKSEFETFPDDRLNDYYLGATLTQRLSATHELQIRATLDNHKTQTSWTACFPQVALLPQLFALYRSNPQYANTILLGRVPSGGTPADDALARQTLVAIQRLGPAALQVLCANPNSDVSQRRSDIELQDTFVFNDALRVVSGVGARYEHATTQTYLAGSVSNTLWRAFANVEYKPFTGYAFNVGGYAERDRYVGTVFSPRAALNVQLAGNQSLRFVVSRGSRTPDLVEQRGNITYSATGSTPGPDGTTNYRFYQSAISPGGLTSERELSREIGYVLNVPKWGLLLDVRAFDDKLTNLISQGITVASFQPTNTNSVRLTGGELQASYVLSPTWSGFLNYAYLRNHEATTSLEQGQYARHSGSVGMSHDFGSGWQGSLAYFGASANGVGDTYYGRTDVSLQKAFDVKASSVLLRLRLSRLDNPTVTYSRSQDPRNAPMSVARSTFNSRTQAYADVSVAF